MPRGIRKGVLDVMEGARSEGEGAGAGRPIPGSGRGGRKVAAGGRAGGRRGGGGQPEADALALEAAGATPLRPEQVVRRIKQLEGEMFRKARNLEFEEAARLRDQIERLKRSELGLTGQRTG